MWFFWGIFVGWLFFCEPTIRNSGMILFNSQQEVLLVQQGIQDLWGFPTQYRIPQNMSFLEGATKALQQTTSFLPDEDYTILPGGCRYRSTMLFFGTVQTSPKTPGAETVQWFSVFNLPDYRTLVVQDWMNDGMPLSCGTNDEL